VIEEEAARLRLLHRQRESRRGALHSIGAAGYSYRVCSRWSAAGAGVRLGRSAATTAAAGDLQQASAESERTQAVNE